MKFEIISDNILKVTLKSEDMIKWNVNYENLTPGNPKANEIFWEIIHRATEETGIEFDNCKLTVEAMRKDAETFVIFITKKQFTGVDEQKKYRYKKAKEKITAGESVLVYSFKEFEDLCKFAKNNLYYCLLFEHKNSLFKQGGEYMLVINITPELKSFVPVFMGIICEYGNLSENSLLQASYLGEHGERLIENDCMKIIYDNF